MKVIFFYHKGSPHTIYSYSPDIAEEGLTKIIWVDWEENDDGIQCQVYPVKCIEKNFDTGEWVKSVEFECEPY